MAFAKHSVRSGPRAKMSFGTKLKQETKFKQGFFRTLFKYDMPKNLGEWE